MLQVNDSNFEQETNQGLVLVDVFTTTCAPCRRQEKILESCQDAVKIVKFDYTDSVEMAEKLGIRAVPTLIFFKDGAEVSRVMGLQSEEAIRQMVSEISGL